jgi:hypothetical protein
MHNDLKDLANRHLVSARLRTMNEPARPAPRSEYANIPEIPKASEYANIPTLPETVEYEQNDRRNPSGPKQRDTVQIPNGWRGNGTFVANTPGGLLFKVQDADANDGLVKFSPNQTKALLASDRHGLIQKSLESGGTATVGYRQDGAVHDWRVTPAQREAPQQQRGIRK